MQASRAKDSQEIRHEQDLNDSIAIYLDSWGFFQAEKLDQSLWRAPFLNKPVMIHKGPQQAQVNQKQKDCKLLGQKQLLWNKFPIDCPFIYKNSRKLKRPRQVWPRVLPDEGQGYNNLEDNSCNNTFQSIFDVWYFHGHCENTGGE